MYEILDTRSAQQAVKAAERRKLPVPQGVYDAAKMNAVIDAASHQASPPRPTPEDIPTTPEQLRALMVQQATSKRHAEYLRSVASDYRTPVAINYNRLVQAAVPGWIASLQPEFEGLIKALTQQARKLPDDLRTEHLDWNNPKISAAWEKAESAAHQLDQLVRDRQDMARAVGGDHVRDAELYAVAQFPEPDVDMVMSHVLRDQIGPFIREWTALAHQPVSRWLHLTRADFNLKLVLATPSETAGRAASMQRWRDGIAGMMSAGGRKAAETAVRQALAA